MDFYVVNRVDLTGDRLSTQIADEVIGGEAVFVIRKNATICPITMHRDKLYTTAFYPWLTKPMFVKDSWTFRMDSTFVNIMFPAHLRFVDTQRDGEVSFLVYGLRVDVENIMFADVEDEDGNWVMPPSIAPWAAGWEQNVRATYVENKDDLPF